jgi:hypothetical protein
LGFVDATNDIAEFLASRRARLPPERVGLTATAPQAVDLLASWTATPEPASNAVDE